MKYDLITHAESIRSPARFTIQHSVLSGVTNKDDCRGFCTSSGKSGSSCHCSSPATTVSSYPNQDTIRIPSYTRPNLTDNFPQL